MSELQTVQEGRLTWITRIAKFIRWQDWGAGKITLLCGLSFYIALAYRIPFLEYVIVFIPFLIFAAAQSALGFVLNDWGDRDLDEAQGKSNIFNQLSENTGRIGLLLTLLVAFVSGLPLIRFNLFIPLWIIWLLFAASYSLKPLRLKTRGEAGLLVSFLAQWSIPVLIAFAVFGQPGSWDGWILALAFTLSGATLEIGHQRYDRQRDTSAGAFTFGAKHSQEKIDRIYILSVLIDKFAIGLVCSLFIYRMVLDQKWWSFCFAAGTGLLYLTLLFASLPQALQAISGGSVQDPYYHQERTAASTLHETLPNLIFPFVFLVTVTLQHPLYGLMLVFFIFWRVILGRADWCYPARFFTERISTRNG